MTELVLRGDIRSALCHMTMIGLAAILENAGAASVRVSWTNDFDPRPLVTTADADWLAAGAIVHAHAARRAADDSWLAARISVEGRLTGLLSPRMKAPADVQGWQELAARRHEVIDQQLHQRTRLDLGLIGALGEPAYWRFNRQHQRLPDEGASRWEMKTRNRGEEFVGNRLYPLAVHVARRDAAGIAAGLRGERTEDEAGRNAPDSRTATGLAAPGRTDNAAAWCALWGISQFPVIKMVARAVQTLGHVREPRRSRGWFYLPVPSAPMPLPRLRSIIASDALAQAAHVGVDSGQGMASSSLDAVAAREWLTARRVGAVAIFPIEVSGSANAPERRALAGRVIPLREVA